MKNTTRKQRISEEEIVNGFKRFYQDFRRYPTTNEIDAYDHLPSAKTIQRRFGSLSAFRQKHSLGQASYTRGEYRSNVARKAYKRSLDQEITVYQLLVDRFGKEFVHVASPLTDSWRIRTDFLVFNQTETFCVDVFYPQDRQSALGCLNLRLKKYAGKKPHYPTFFLSMNPALPQSELDDLVASRKHPMPNNERVVSLETFKSFINTLSPIVFTP